MGTRQGILRALAVTGGVTSAGLVLPSPRRLVVLLLILTQIAFIVAFVPAEHLRPPLVVPPPVLLRDRGGPVVHRGAHQLAPHLPTGLAARHETKI